MIFSVLLSWFWELLYFPFWWYTEGFLGVLKGAFAYLQDEFTALGIAVWAKNLFVPMYGQRDIGSRLISFFMRLVQIIFRSLYWFLIMVLLIILLALWLIAPLVVLTMLILQLI